jgi:phosphoribosyl-AMP cyclohydrolase
MPSSTSSQNDSSTSPTRGPAGEPPLLDPAVAGALKKDDAGLVAAVVQQYDTLEVLMLGWMDEEALRRTLTSGRVTFYSRSRSEYWRKGDTSGHRQWVKAVALDCDGDALLVTVDQEGAACHTGTRTCFDGRALPAVTASRTDAEGL